eukprot:scaffold145609_cov19-Tisochrysis_lutea.AAC.2
MSIISCLFYPQLSADSRHDMIEKPRSELTSDMKKWSRSLFVRTTVATHCQARGAAEYPLQQGRVRNIIPTFMKPYCLNA